MHSEDLHRACHSVFDGAQTHPLSPHFNLNLIEVKNLAKTGFDFTDANHYIYLEDLDSYGKESSKSSM